MSEHELSASTDLLGGCPTISITIDAEKDGTFTAHLIVSGLTSFAKANAAREHMQRLFCGDEIYLADKPPNAIIQGPRSGPAGMEG